ncbi:hypothetical protein P7H17_15235 [Paenibacillus larvae]|nr:hypothetical protein [Paenibacillus larvae]MDT2287114.1 hypothetical protein [Paenibacillus larvae]
MAQKGPFLHEKRWKIVAFHRAAYQSNPTREEDATKRIIAPILEVQA